MARIELKNLTKEWRGFYGARNISLEIKDKEFLVLLGPSGCGKTTTMRMIAGLEVPTAGEVWIGDRMVNRLEPKDRDVAMVFQSYGLYAHLSVYDNICFPLKVRKLPTSEHKERVLKAARMVEMEDFLDRRPRALSGGQRQRVALARAIVREPNCFLMDEPLSNLDAQLRVTMRAELKHLQHSLQTTTVFVTHDQIEAMTLADRVAVMEKGVIRQLGTPKEIYDDPENLFVAGFIGSPAMNLVKGGIEKQHFTNDIMSLPVPKYISSYIKEGKIIMGIRAEDIHPTNRGGSIKGSIYSVELLGESSLVTIKTEQTTVIARAAKDFNGAIGDQIACQVNEERLYYFDASSGKRIRSQ